MREEDVAPLTERFDEGEYREDAAHIALRRLGYQIRDLAALEHEMFEDLDERTYGFGWWRDHLPTRQRIYVSDHLLDVITDIPQTMMEAWVHLSAWRRLRAESDRNRKWRMGRSRFKLTPPSSPAEDLSRVERRAQFGGLFRALGTTLDLLATAVVGVGGLPTRLRRADLGTAQRLLAREQHAEVAEALRLDETLSNAGPAGWDAWTLGMRNTTVHRPRPMVVSHFRTPIQIGPRSIHYLPASPGHSRVEAVLASGALQLAYMDEDADETMSGVLVSTFRVVEELAPRLLELWRRRRVDPSWIEQPDQWDETPDDPGFRGYRRDARLTDAPDVNEMMLSPKARRRMKAAALFDEERWRWETFE